MRDRVARLRVWLLGSAVFLLLVIAGFIGYARYLRHHWAARLPAKLGIDVKSDASGVTFSQYNDKLHRTIYTIHAGKQTEFKNGLISLHNVSIVLYGQRGDRADRIYGDEFEYDQNAGVVRAKGLVHIDLQAAPKSVAGATGASDNSDVESQGGPKVMHVTTSNLVYLQKLGVAATSEPIEFESGALTGHATGADYSSDSGLLILHSAVSMSGVSGGRPLSVTAGSAEFNGRSNDAVLTNARYQSPGRSAEAQHATLYRRNDGTLERVVAEGSVTMQADSGTVTSQKADVALNAASQPQMALLTGGVLYTSAEPLREVRGAAQAATITFTGKSRTQPRHAVFTGGVHLIERTRSSEAVRAPWSIRDLTAAKLETALLPDPQGRAVLRDAEATGDARLTMVDNGRRSSANGRGETEISADDLKAHLVETADAKGIPRLDTLEGRGHTFVRQVSDGKEQTSAGDLLDAKFRPAPVNGSASAKGNQARGVRTRPEDVLWNAVQEGHVSVVRRDLDPSGKDGVERATSQRATYNGDQDRITLTGDVQLTGTDGTLWAQQVGMNRMSGDAQASGGVKVEYVQAGSSGPGGDSMHILADRAELVHATQTVTFEGRPARMWQAGSQVQAPVIEIARPERRLIARGRADSRAPQVFTVLANAAQSGKDAAAGNGGAAAARRCIARPVAQGGAGGPSGISSASPQAVRIASGGVMYSDILRQAEFTGGVRADTPDATMRATQATAYLGLPAGMAPAKGVGVPSLNGNLEKIVASGNVSVVEPGLQATGERLVYTAADQVFLLTGTAAVPPKAVGVQGTTSGAALRLNSCDDSVEALSGTQGATEQRVHTDLRVRDQSRKEKGKQ